MQKNPFITIDGRRIGLDEPPYMIAEISANHNGKLSNAIRLIDEARLAGSDAVKLQTYRPDTMTIDCDNDDFNISGGLWDGKTLYQLYEEAHMPWEWHETLFQHALNVGITIFSTPFDNSSIDFLEDLNAPAYKIASFELIDLPLIQYAAATGKPMIISTGMANEEEIQEAIATAQDNGCKELAILHCVSGYPAPSSDYNLKTIPDMISRYGYVTGLSDHTLDNTSAIVGIALGASIIEKHFTLDRNGDGPDDSFSLEPVDFMNLCNEAKSAWNALGCIDYTHKESEKQNLKFRRSIYAVKNISAGDKLTHNNIRSIRPGFGLPPKLFKEIVGKTAKVNIDIGTPLNFEHII